MIYIKKIIFVQLIYNFFWLLIIEKHFVYLLINLSNIDSNIIFNTTRIKTNMSANFTILFPLIKFVRNLPVHWFLPSFFGLKTEINVLLLVVPAKWPQILSCPLSGMEERMEILKLKTAHSRAFSPNFVSIFFFPFSECQIWWVLPSTFILS